MQFTISRERLTSCLKAVIPSIGVAATDSLPGALLVTADEDGVVTFVGRSLTSHATFRTTAEVGEEGAFVIDGRRLALLAKEYPGSEIEFSGKTAVSSVQQIRIASMSSWCRLLVAGPENFARPSNLRISPIAVVPQSEFTTLLSKVVHATASDASRPALNGVNLTFEDGCVTAIATDGRRLAHARARTPGGNSASFTIGTSFVTTALRVLGCGSNVEVRLRDGRLALALDTDKSEGRMVGQGTVGCQTVQERYPDYRAVVPAPSDARVKLDLGAFTGALERAYVLTGRQARPVELDFRDDRLVVVAKDETGNSSTEEVPTVLGRLVGKIFVPAAPMLDVLRVATAETITFEQSKALAPCIVRESADVFYLVMPLRFPS